MKNEADFDFLQSGTLLLFDDENCLHWLMRTMKMSKTEERGLNFSINKNCLKLFFLCMCAVTFSFSVSADAQSDFLEALSRGLNSRWSYSSQMEEKEASMSAEEHREYYLKLAQLELTEVESYYNKEFEDEKFGTLVKTYIEGVRLQKESARSGEFFSTLYDAGWSCGYNIRALTIIEFCDQYGLEIDSDTLQEFRDAAAYWNLYSISETTATPTPKPTKKPKATATPKPTRKPTPVLTPTPKPAKKSTEEEQDYEIPEDAYDLLNVLHMKKGKETLRSLYYEYCETRDHKEGVRVYFEYVNNSNEGNLCMNTFYYDVYSDNVGIYNTTSTDRKKSQKDEIADWTSVKNGRPNVFAWVFEFDDNADTIDMRIFDSSWKDPSPTITFFREGIGTFEVSA